MSLDQKQLLWQGCAVLSDFGIFDEHGHLSARATPGSDTVMINARSSPRTTSLQDFVEFDLGADAYPDTVPGETSIHAEVFRAREDVNAICHHHSPYAVAVVGAGLDMRPVHPNGAVQAGSVTVYDDLHEAGGVLVTTDEEGAALASALGNDYVLMLRGHGAVVVGESVAEVVTCSIKLEFNARLLHLQASVGEPWYLPEELVKREVKRVHSKGVTEKSLDYYLAESRRR